jgi:type I restriction enzyme S subunit
MTDKDKLPEGWKRLPLGEICSFFSDGNWIESKDQSIEGIRLLQVGNIT